MLTLDDREGESVSERAAGEEAAHEEEPWPPNPTAIPIDDGEEGQQDDVDDRVVLAGRCRCGIDVAQCDELLPAARSPDRVAARNGVLGDELVVEVVAESDRRDADGVVDDLQRGERGPARGASE